MRLIDADALKKDLDTIWFADRGNCSDVYSCVTDAPTIYAVEVIRCKGCKRWYSDGHIQWCKEWKHGTSENGYCHKADPIEREVEK